MKHPSPLAFALAASLLLAAPACDDAGGPQPSEASDTVDAADAADTADAPGGEVDAAPATCPEDPGGQITLPEDDARHDVATEWWYWTGHLRAEDGRWFGFQVSFFPLGKPGNSVSMVHLALTDVAGGRFLHRIEVGDEIDQLEEGFTMAIEGTTATGAGGHDALAGSFENGAGLALTLSPGKGVVLQHGDGYKDYGDGIYTYYYSRPRMQAAGAVTLDGVATPVSGIAWFDHQWGSFGGDGPGWDWFALQLDDGREMTVINIRKADGSHVAEATVVSPACDTHLEPDATVKVTPQSSWTSPESGCTYPMGWELEVDGETFVVTPALEDQELRSAITTYWEGAATVSGAATGRAYAEMVGYCP